MYTVVLMMTLSGAPADTGHLFNRCNGCSGAATCHGGGYACSGSSCHGGGGLFHRSSCRGSCHGGGLFSGSCHGGGLFSGSCHGGGLFGGSCHGGGLFQRRSHCHGGYACSGAHVACSGACTGGVIVDKQPEKVPPPKEKKEKKQGEEENFNETSIETPIVTDRIVERTFRAPIVFVGRFAR